LVFSVGPVAKNDMKTMIRRKNEYSSGRWIWGEDTSIEITMKSLKENHVSGTIDSEHVQLRKKSQSLANPFPEGTKTIAGKRNVSARINF